VFEPPGVPFPPPPPDTQLKLPDPSVCSTYPFKPPLIFKLPTLPKLTFVAPWKLAVALLRIEGTVKRPVPVSYMNVLSPPKSPPLLNCTDWLLPPGVPPPLPPPPVVQYKLPVPSVAIT
jgi:hypothetical protein